MNNTPKENQFLITIKTIFGLEDALTDELMELGYKKVEKLNRAVQIEGSWKDVYFLNLHLRCANAVLVQIDQFKIKNEKDLYHQAMKIDWTSIFDVKKTFVIKGAVFSDLFSHTQYPNLLLKDAICDVFREEVGDRPNIELKTPQVVFDLYINKDLVTISVNTSGNPLYHRNYRQSTGLAPLNEVVAAGMIRMSGWDKKSDFYDPFCGSGTLLIEAALLAANIPSNIERQHYAFKNFKNYDAALWEEIYDAANKRCTELPCKIYGGDISDEMVLKARRNFRALPIGRFIEIKNQSFEDFTPTGKGVMISNPPYGERMGEEVEEMYGKLGSWMKHKLAGWSCWVISSNENALQEIGLKPDKKIKMYNGDLECSFRKYTIFEGKKEEALKNSEENN